MIAIYFLINFLKVENLFNLKNKKQHPQFNLKSEPPDRVLFLRAL